MKQAKISVKSSKLPLVAGIWLLMSLLLLSACGDTATSAATTASAATTVATTSAATTTSATAAGATTTSGEATTAAGATTTSGTASNLQGTIRLGYLPNLTHPQALYGLGSGLFNKELGSGVTLKTTSFNAGPDAIEALLAGDLDLAYVGPNPAINGYIKTNGASLRVIAGAASGGVSFVVRGDENITSAKDLANKKFATPQLGNTQDVALRNYLAQNGLKTTDKGGNVQIIPTANSNILQLFQNKQIDGAWVPEPYATQLVVQYHGKVFLDESSLWPQGKFTITLIVASTKFLNAHPDLVKAFLAAHLDATQAIQKDPATAATTINAQLKKLSGKALPDEVLTTSFGKIQLTVDPVKSSLITAANEAFQLGFLGKTQPDLSNLYDLTILNQLLTERGLATVS